MRVKVVCLCCPLLSSHLISFLQVEPCPVDHRLQHPCRGRGGEVHRGRWQCRFKGQRALEAGGNPGRAQERPEPTHLRGECTAVCDHGESCTVAGLRRSYWVMYNTPARCKIRLVDIGYWTVSQMIYLSLWYFCMPNLPVEQLS